MSIHYILPSTHKRVSLTTLQAPLKYQSFKQFLLCARGPGHQRRVYTRRKRTTLQNYSKPLPQTLHNTNRPKLQHRPAITRLHFSINIVDDSAKPNLTYPEVSLFHISIPHRPATHASRTRCVLYHVISTLYKMSLSLVGYLGD